MTVDPFARLPLPTDHDELLKLAFLACQCREHGVTLVVVADEVVPLLPFPWSPQEARVLHRILHHVERCRDFLQGHADVFPAMDLESARQWADDLARHHGAGAWPGWWSVGVVDIARALLRVAGRVAA